MINAEVMGNVLEKMFFELILQRFYEEHSSTGKKTDVPELCVVGEEVCATMR